MVNAKLEGAVGMGRGTVLDGVRQFSQHIPLWSNVHDIPIPCGWDGCGVPHAESFVMFGCQYYVLCPGIGKKFGPLCGIVEFRMESGRVFLVGKSRSFRLLYKVLFGSKPIVTFPVIPEPFRCEGWYTEHTPMQKDSKFGFVVPWCQWTIVQFLPRRSRKDHKAAEQLLLLRGKEDGPEKKRPPEV